MTVSFRFSCPNQPTSSCERTSSAAGGIVGFQIQVTSGDVAIRENVVTGVRSEWGGVRVESQLDGHVLIAENELFGNDRGIQLTDVPNASVTENEIDWNTIGGVRIDGASTVQLEGNEIRKNMGYGMCADDNATVDIDKNRIKDNGIDVLFVPPDACSDDSDCVDGAVCRSSSCSCP